MLLSSLAEGAASARISRAPPVYTCPSLSDASFPPPTVIAILDIIAGFFNSDGPSDQTYRSSTLNILTSTIGLK